MPLYLPYTPPAPHHLRPPLPLPSCYYLPHTQYLYPYLACPLLPHPTLLPHPCLPPSHPAHTTTLDWISAMPTHSRTTITGCRLPRCRCAAGGRDCPGGRWVAAWVAGGTEGPCRAAQHLPAPRAATHGAIWRHRWEGMYGFCVLNYHYIRICVCGQRELPAAVGVWRIAAPCIAGVLCVTILQFRVARRRGEYVSTNSPTGGRARARASSFTHEFGHVLAGG